MVLEQATENSCQSFDAGRNLVKQGDQALQNCMGVVIGSQCNGVEMQHKFCQNRQKGNTIAFSHYTRSHLCYTVNI
jgi:hypothetical protein